MITRRFAQLDAMEQVKSLLKGVSGESISVPSIVVVGAQSSGKSSVLEHATGLAFPRGEGMCTRVPTIVSVEGGADEEGLVVSTDPEYGVAWELVESGAVLDTTFTMQPGDSEAFGKAIETLTNRMTKTGEISDTPIYVKYKRRSGPTFTLTDVPGITCNSKHAKGSVVEQQTIALTRKMIGDSADTLVLVVLPATEDFDNSKALQLAMELDPEGERTIGVVTKIDNLPPGSELVKHMSGDAIYLRHGFFAVRNRTQKEIHEDMDMNELERAETELFATDEVLKFLPEEQRGMPRLLDKVANEQGRRLDECIPKLRSEIQERIHKDIAALGRLPEPMEDDAARRQYLNRKLARIEADFRRCVESDTSVMGVACKVTNLAARVHEVMGRLADNTHSKMPKFTSTEMESQLVDANCEGQGYNLSNFMQSAVLRSAFAAVAPVLEEEATAAVRDTHDCVNACFDALVDHHLGDGVVPGIRVALKQHFRDMLIATVSNTARLIERLQRAEANVTYTRNHYYMQTILKFEKTVREQTHNWRRGAVSGSFGCDVHDIPEEFMKEVASNFHAESNDHLGVNQTQISLHAYAKVVQKRFVDSVAALLISEVVMGTADTLTDEVINWSVALQAKVQEDPGAAHKRATLTNNVQRLKQALALLKSF